MNSSEMTVADYLLTHLKDIGVNHLFDVPGDFVLGCLDQGLKSDLGRDIGLAVKAGAGRRPFRVCG